MVGTADSALIREVSLNQSVLYREVPLYALYLYHVHYDAPCSTGGDVSGDLLSTSGTLQFLTGVSQQTLTLSILADDIPEETEVSIHISHLPSPSPSVCGACMCVRYVDLYVHYNVCAFVCVAEAGGILEHLRTAVPTHSHL